ncbi:carbohydrate ABC transporter permease [Paenibacillus guangzhouensis]|uniref:carbohydrate ABC transporter permease n=1 Tax=Paenibacillus guangzhouensis TaxID=1473112 RepID=UPI0012675316|nr:carbohydrate ABC transporter permease [Paenibacillus guangzhouensis]
MSYRIRRIVPHVVLLVYVVIVLYPLLFVINASLKNNSEITTNPWGLPQQWYFENYTNALSNALFGRYFLNSLYISATATVLTILLSTALAFALTRMRFRRPGQLVYGFLLLSLLIPPASLLIPLYIMVKDVGLYNTPFALIVPYTTFGLPLTVFIIAAFLKSIPRELEEAGVVDGLSIYGVLGRVVIPLTMPTLVTVFILNFINHWNEFIMANLFLSTQQLRTLPVAIVAFADQFNMNYGALTASITISIVPVIIIYALLQKKIIEGVAAGSIKG